MSETRDLLMRQFDIAAAITHYHLDTLTTEECLWRPASKGLHVYQNEKGEWEAEWPEHEAYSLGPPSAAWTTWHIIFWWSMITDHCFHEGKLTKEQIRWPGSADAVRERINGLEAEWRKQIASLTEEELHSTEKSGWMFSDKPFVDVIAWATVELTKNASELGYIRFLYAVRPDADNLSSI